MLIFPNLIILDLMGVVIRKITPTSAGQTKITQWSLATAGESADMRARRLENFITFQGPGGFATPDDLEALEACQAGFRTGAGVPWSDISRGDAPRAQWPVLLQRRRAADARLLAPVAEADKRGMTLPLQSGPEQSAPSA